MDHPNPYASIVLKHPVASCIPVLGSSVHRLCATSFINFCSYYFCSNWKWFCSIAVFSMCTVSLRTLSFTPELIFRMLVITFIVSAIGMVVYMFIIIYFICKWGFTRWQCTTIRHNTQITHHTQTKHSTQIYTNNKGHTTHNESHYTLCQTSIFSSLS
jgi:hypothetical protein